MPEPELPPWPEPLLPLIGKNSLFLYLMHTALFWALIFRFDRFSTVTAVLITGLITVAAAVLVGTVYDLLLNAGRRKGQHRN